MLIIIVIAIIMFNSNLHQTFNFTKEFIQYLIITTIIMIFFPIMLYIFIYV